MNSELKPTYKDSAVGEIPEDWNILPLARISRAICDGTHFTPRYVSQGIPFYSVENITLGDFTNTKFISEEEHAILIKRCKPERGDILMTRITAGVLGDTKLLDWDVDASVYVSLALIKLNQLIDAKYFYRYTKSSIFVREVEKRSLLNATPKKINMRDIGAIPVPVPSTLHEQQAIAEALSDADALIESLEQLIAKKRLLKQGAMQELLTGKKRLPGFSGEWNSSRLGDLAETLSGTTPSRAMHDRYYAKGTIPWVKTMDLRNTDLYQTSESITELALKETCLRIYPVGTVLVAMYGGFQQIGRTGLLRIPASVNQAISAIRLKTQMLVPEFLIALLNHRVDYWKDVASSSRKDPNITSRDIRDFPISYPSFVEQNAIAEVLSIINQEIAMLECKLANARAIKQGMMQELLTGRIRLV